MWRFVGALALAPLSGSAFAQDVGVPPAYVPGMYQPEGYAPAGYVPGGAAPGGYAGLGGGYVTPAGSQGPMVAPPPMIPGGGGGGIAIPSGSVFTPRLVTSGGYGDGLGWDEGYQSIGAWLPLGINTDTQLVYLDARGFSSFTEGGGGNFNLGYRNYVPGLDRFFGGYGGFDIDAGNAESQDFSRFAVGLESVGRYLQYRVNGYIPVGDQSHTVASGQVGDLFFAGNNIFFLDRTITRYQYGGVDGELGGPLPLVGKYGLSGYLGGYWLTSDVDDTIGFKGRVEANINDDLQVGAKLTHDDIFDTNCWVTMTLRSPRGGWSDFFRRDWLRQPSVGLKGNSTGTWMDRSPEREYRIATDVKTNDSDVLAIDPADGLPYVVLHVAQGAGGNGTFENPASGIVGFNTPVYDIIYVRPGTYITAGPIALFDNQRLLSTAVRHTIDTQRGTFFLPGFTGGPLPTLQNSVSVPSAVILLANNNEVSGFHIDGTGTPDPFTGTPVFHTGIAGAAVTSFDINRNLFTNVTSGINITHVGTGTGLIQGNVLTGMGFGSSSGVQIAAVNASALNLVVAGNSVTGFLGEDADASGSLSTGEDLNNNNVLDPGIGVNVVADGGSFVNAQINGNNLSDNGTGLRLASQGGSTVNAAVTGNIIQTNAEAGVSVEASAATAFANFVANDISNNLGPGIQSIGLGGSNLTLFLGGDNPTAGNVLDGNAGTALGMTLDTGSTGRIVAVNNFFTDSVDDNDPLTRFDGTGIDILVGDSARFIDSYFDKNVISGNATAGVRITAQGLATVRNVTFGNFDGNNNNGNFISGNFNGVEVIRSGNARIDELRFIDNEIVTNTANGIDFFIDGGLLDVADVLVADNNISGNGVDGIFGLVQSDGIISLDLRNNLIVGNGNDGVSFQQNRFAIDQGGVTGVWVANLISNNGGDGIDIGAPMLDLQVGTTDIGNTIIRNGEAGIDLPGPGSATFTRNLIAQNGAALNTGNANTDNTFGAGIDIGGVGFKDLLFVNNTVIDNFGDGVEIAVGENGASQFFNLNFTDNIVARNDGRGYDVLNQGSSLLNLTIRGTAPGRSQIAENGREGVYIVNTSSRAQLQSGPTPVVGNPSADPTHGMDATGNIFESPVINFTFVQNQVVGNGQDQNNFLNDPGQSVGGSGLVFRIGTAGGGYGPFAFGVGDDGGFASQGFAGVIASVTDNFFSGNFGADVYAESFTSTVAPPATNGTWSATQFVVNSYFGDPLARFDLNFVNNTFESTSFNNEGAWYNNAEGTFKSRTNGRTPPDPQGPFDSAARRRNAQRLAYRDETLPSSQFPGGQPENDGFIAPGVPFYDLPPQPNSAPLPGYPTIDDLFLYAGMGQSTFRISGLTFAGTNTVLNPDGTTTVVAGFAPFLMDDFPYNDIFDANGVLLINANFPDELPYGWSLMP